jgi:hypothetical protein
MLIKDTLFGGAVFTSNGVIIRFGRKTASSKVLVVKGAICEKDI